MTRLVDEGLVAEDWKETPTKGIATSSVVMFVVREGNPEGIETWDDLVKSGVEIITPNPGSSGSARWNILAAWAHVVGNGGTEAEATEFLTDLLNNTIALPGSGREATTAFTDGSGDVLLSYENEAILAKQSGADVDYIVPPDTLLIENPAAVTADADETAQAFLEFITGPEAQADYAQSGFRPGRGRRRDRGRRGCQRPVRPVPRPRRSSSPSTVTSTAGARPPTSTSATVRTATRSASSPSSSRTRARSARSNDLRPARRGAHARRAGIP